MTDFLAHLVGKTLGTEPSLRPVMAPVFAPTSAATMFLTESDYRLEAAPEDRSERKNRESSSLLPPITRGQWRSNTSSLPRDILLPTSQQDVSQQEQHGSTEQNKNIIRPAISQASTQIERTRIVPLIQTELRERSSLSSGEKTRNTNTPSSNFSRDIRVDVDHNTASTTPTINVSIGRIDIRAVVAPVSSTPKKTPTAPPQPSLNDYLQMRNRGRR